MTAVDTRPREAPLPSPGAIPRRGALAAALAVPALLLAVIAVSRFVNGRAGLDLPHFDQGLWLVSQGHGPDSTVFGEGLLRDHFGPAILVFAPLYRLAATPVWLVVAQAVAAWAAVWQISGRLLPTLGWKRAALIGGALLLSPPVAYALLWDVHPVVLAVPFALAAVFAVQDDRPWRAFGFGLVAAMLRADVAYAVLAAFVFLPGLSRRRLQPALLLLAYVAIATYLEMSLGGDGAASSWSGYYGRLGASPVDAVTHPWRFVAVLATPTAFGKALPWLACGAFLCLARPRLMLPGIAVGLTTLLSDWPGTALWGFHYGMAPALLLAVAWIPVLQRRPEWARLVPGAVLVLSLIGGPFVPWPVIDTGAARAASFLASDPGAGCIVRGIPDDAAVSAHVAPGSFLAHRPALFYWPYPFEGIPWLPSLAAARPDLAETVDYVVRHRESRWVVPEGFVPDGATTRYERFRRQATTEARTPVCASGPAASRR